MTMTTEPNTDLGMDDARSVLAAIRGSRHREIVEQADQLSLAVAWAAMHSVDSIDDGGACFGDTPIAIAGEGAPLVAEFSLAEFALAMGLPTEARKGVRR